MKKELASFAALFCFLSPVAQGADSELLDVRTKAEWDEKHVEGSMLIDFRQADFREQLGRLDKNKSYAVYCRSGNRSGSAVKVMKEMGFKNVSNLGTVEDALKSSKAKCVGSKC